MRNSVSTESLAWLSKAGQSQHRAGGACRDALRKPREHHRAAVSAPKGFKGSTEISFRQKSFSLLPFEDAKN